MTKTQLTIPGSNTNLSAKESIQLSPPVISRHETPNYIFIPFMLTLFGLSFWIYKKRVAKQKKRVS